MSEQISDVFISYAHADDEVPLGAKTGWVTTFVDELTKLLRRKLGGGGATIWMDHQLAANDKVNQTLMDSVRCSRTLVLFMSKGYAKSTWCQKELGEFLESNKDTKNKASVFIVELDLTKRESWHPRLQALTPIRFWRENRNHIPELLGMPVPKPDQDDPYWQNLNTLGHLIARHLEDTQDLPGSEEIKPEISSSVINFSITPPTPPPLQNTKPVIWVAEPTDDLIDQWESLAAAILQAGAELRPLGLDTYPRSSEKEFIEGLNADLSSAQLFVQLLGPVPGRRPKDSMASFTAIQSATAGDLSKQKKSAFLQWRNLDLNPESITDENHRQLLTGAIACGFEEFRQRVLTTIQNLNLSSPPVPPTGRESLAICISANTADRDLGVLVSDILDKLGQDALTTPTEPALGQTSTDFLNQWDEIISSSEGLIIVYGQTPPSWVQAQYMRARKALAKRRKGVWGGLLDGPPNDKPDAGVTSQNIKMLKCRDGSVQQQVEHFVNILRGGGND